MSLASFGAHKEFSLSFLQPARIQSSAEAIATFSNDSVPGSGNSCLWEALRALQHPDILLSNAEAVTAVWYEGPDDVFNGAVGALMGGVHASEVAVPYSHEPRRDVMQAFRQSLDLFAVKFPHTFAVFCKTIRYVIFAHREGYSGGTVSSRIGMIWLAPQPHWTAETWLENLIHEFVHNALFIEDMVHQLLVAGGDRLDQPDAQAISAIRQIKRGYDKSYHSAFVSFTIIEMYHAIGRAELAIPFVAPLMVCLKDLIDQRRFATPHGEQLLIELVEASLPVYSGQSEYELATTDY